MFSWNIALNVQSFIISEVKLVLQTVNYSRNSAWKFGRKIQNHWDNNAFFAVGSFILPHPVVMMMMVIMTTTMMTTIALRYLA